MVDDGGDVFVVEDVAVGGGFEAVLLHANPPPSAEETLAEAGYELAESLWR